MANDKLKACVCKKCKKWFMPKNGIHWDKYCPSCEVKNDK